MRARGYSKPHISLLKYGIKELVRSNMGRGVNTAPHNLRKQMWSVHSPSSICLPFAMWFSSNGKAYISTPCIMDGLVAALSVAE